jgi:NAD(P)-dependent dehydrogenase (short-subunit alcohol dehydrogenase family)
MSLDQASRSQIISNNIEGKVIVVTGASSGLGEATARLLSAEGATVALGARRADRLQSLALQICRTEEGDSCSDRPCVAARQEAVDRADPRHHEAASIGGNFGAVNVQLTPDDLSASESASSEIKGEGARYPQFHEQLTAGEHDENLRYDNCSHHLFHGLRPYS